MISKKIRYCLIGLLCLSSMLLLSLTALGIYNRPQNDDFYYLANTGLTPHDNFNWESNGRIASLLTYYLLYPIPGIIQIAPAITVCLIVTSLFVFLHSLFTLLAKNQVTRLLSLTCATFLSASTIILLPGVYAGVFWFIALPPHTWSFCLAVLYIGLLLRAITKPQSQLSYQNIALFFIAPLLIGTFYEAASLILVIASTAALAIAYRKKLKNRLLQFWASVGGSLLSLVVLLFSPGALRRRELAAAMHENSMVDRLVHLPGVLFHNYFITLPKYLNHPEMLFILLGAGCLVGIYCLGKKRIIPRAAMRYAFFAILAVGIFITIDMSVVWIGLNELQSVREYFSLTLGITIGLFIIGILIGQSASFTKTPPRQRLLLGGAALFVVVPLALNLCYLPALNTFRRGMTTYSQQWDSRDKAVKSAVSRGECMIPVNSLAINGLWHVKRTPSYWVNSAMSFYYDVRRNGKLCRVYAESTKFPFGKQRAFEYPAG